MIQTDYKESKDKILEGKERKGKERKEEEQKALGKMRIGLRIAMSMKNMKPPPSP